MNFIRQLIFRPLRPVYAVPVRGFKHKGVLQLRCDGCYFKNLDNRWYVLCTKQARHKQVEKVARDKFRYIVSERVAQGYPAFKKRFMHPNHILE